MRRVRIGPRYRNVSLEAQQGETTMASQLLPDGSEKGLSGHNIERMPRQRVGLAPPAGEIDRTVPYKRIATEEEGHFRAGEAKSSTWRAATRPTTLLEWAACVLQCDLQRRMPDSGRATRAHGEYGIDRQLLLLTRPAWQGEVGRGDALR